MATCSQITGIVQAWVDGELGSAERLILETHIADCKACSDLAYRQQATSALMFEVLGEHRLKNDVSTFVMDHLPEMDKGYASVAEVNWRAKHPVDRLNLFIRRVSLVAAGLLLIFALALFAYWPNMSFRTQTAVGMVTFVSGSAQGAIHGQREEKNISAEALVSCGERFQTGSASSLIVSLKGPSDVEIDENTSIKIRDERSITVEKGRVLLHVAKGDREFQVKTPYGEIAVLGTVFDVNVRDGRSLVTVIEGTVSVRNDITDTRVDPGLQVEVAHGRKALTPYAVDTRTVIAWADRIEPDPKSYARFQEKIPGEQTSLAGDQVFVVITERNSRITPISAIKLDWDPDTNVSGHCSYDLFVYNDAMDTPLLQEHIDGSLFANKSVVSHQVRVPDKPITDVKVLHIKVTPDFSTGRIETPFKVSALGL